MKPRWRWDWRCSWWCRSTLETFDVVLHGQIVSAFRKKRIV